MARPKRERFYPELAQYRKRARMTQEQVAERLGITPEMVRRHERGDSLPVAQTRQKYCALYQASEEQLGLRPQVDHLPPPQPSIAVVSALPEDVVDVLARVRKLEATAVGDAELMVLELAIEDFILRYEDLGPAPLIPPLVKQRQSLESLIDSCRSPGQRQRLFRIAGQTSALLSYMAVNRSQFPLSRAYSVEAFQLAEFAGDRELQAWIRGTQSFCEYYAGRYKQAYELARDGQSYAGDSVQNIRLVINGEARALGKLGDAEGVHRAVARAQSLMDAVPDVPGFSPCISFGSYSRGRTESNAVTAYVDLGLPDEVECHAALAMPEFEASESSWSKSLIRLDLANSLVRAKNPDPGYASLLVHEALNISAEKPIASVLMRSKEFVRSTARWADVQAVASVREAVSSAHLR